MYLKEVQEVYLLSEKNSIFYFDIFYFNTDSQGSEAIAILDRFYQLR